MTTEATTTDEAQRPTRHDIRTAIDANAVELAEAEQGATPGATRVSLLVRKENDGVTARVRTDNSNATQIPPLNENEVYLWRIADAHEFQSDEHREWWLSGEAVEDEGVDFFDHIEESED